MRGGEGRGGEGRGEGRRGEGRSGSDEVKESRRRRRECIADYFRHAKISTKHRFFYGEKVGDNA